MNNQISLHNGMLAIAGTIAILAGLTFNAYLMTTYAEGLGVWMQGGMALLGVVLDTIKIAFIVLFFTVLLPTGQYGKAFFVFCFTVLLIALSLFSGFGAQINVLTSSEKALIEGSQAKVMAQSNLSNAQETLQSLSGASGLNVAELQGKMDALLNSKPLNSRGTQVSSSLGSLTSNCSNTSTWYYRYCADYPNLKKQLNEASQYQTAKQSVKDAEKSVLSVGTLQGDIEQIATNPVFLYASNLTGYTPKQVKTFVANLISFLLEFVGTLALIVSGAGRKQIITESTGYDTSPSVAYVAKGKPYQFNNRSQNSELGSLNSGFDSDMIGAKMPISEQSFEAKMPISDNEAMDTEKPVKSQARRSKGTPDTNTSGEGSKRYHFVRKQVKNGSLKPSLYALTKVKYGGVSISKPTAIAYQLAMAKEGLIEQTKARNGKQTFRLKVAEVSA